MDVPPLFTERKERDRLDECANFFSLIKAMEHLERAYMRDAIDSTEYTNECSKIIGKFKTTERSLIAGKIIISTEDFMKTYNLEDCRAAKECLLIRGVPMTVLYRAPVGEHDAGAAIAETTETIITCLDSLNLGNHVSYFILSFVLSHHTHCS